MGATAVCACRERSKDEEDGNIKSAERDDELDRLREKVAKLAKRNEFLEAELESLPATPRDPSRELTRRLLTPRRFGARDFSSSKLEGGKDASFPEERALDSPSPSPDPSPRLPVGSPSAWSSLAAGRPRLPVALLFADQAPRLAGALADLASGDRQALLESASKVLGYDLGRLCAEGQADDLEQTRRCQPAVYVACIAAVERLRAERPEVIEQCHSLAGCGVGEFAALHVAGVFDFELGLELVQLRAEEMHLAAQVGEQQQLSLTGVEFDRVRNLCEEARRTCGEGEVCSVSYALLPKGHICAGTKPAIDRLFELGSSQSRVNVRASLLSTPQEMGYGAFHTKLMEGAQRKLRVRLRELVPRMRPPRCPVYFNSMGEALPKGADPSLIAELLAAQLTTTVLWEQTVRTMRREGVEEFVVCGPRTPSQLVAVMEKLAPGVAVTQCCP